MEALYDHARKALYAKIDTAVIKDASARFLRIQSKASSRDDYLMHPSRGESISKQDVSRIAALYLSERPQAQIVISDGLNANAVNENLRATLPPLRRMLAEAGCNVGDVDIVVENGRVRAGYHVGALLDVDVIVHLIGERPGTGLNTLSAYITYGRDRRGLSRWADAIDHSNTNAVCGINRRGKHPSAAIEVIALCIRRIFEERRSGIELDLQARLKQ